MGTSADSGYRHSATVTVPDEVALRELLREPLDFGCKPSVSRLRGGGFGVTVIATDAELKRLERLGRDVTRHPLPSSPAEVGTGDRFEGGRVLARGFGGKEPVR